MDYRQIPAMFLADAPGLDFLNSIATPVDVPVDWISDGEGLLRWLDQAGMLPPDALAAIRARTQPTKSVCQGFGALERSSLPRPICPFAP